MPRKNLARRFEPRAGVSQAMLEAESQYVGHELQDYLLWSINELRKKLSERQVQMTTAEANLQFRLSHLPDRERLAIRCMLARDFLHIAALYEKFLESPAMAEATGPCEPATEELTPEDEPIPAVPFTGWLFGADPATK